MILLVFDIRTEDSAKIFLENFFNTTIRTLIEMYNKDSEYFWSLNDDLIKSKNIFCQKFVVMHYTSSLNKCDCIKQNGINSLQWALTKETELKMFLASIDVRFDLKNKELYFNKEKYDIDYHKYQGRHDLNKSEEVLRKISRKIYSDYSINGYFYKDKQSRNDYQRPEFLMNISKLNTVLWDIEHKWIEESKRYIVNFIADLEQIQLISFEINNCDFYSQEEKAMIIKKWMIENAISRIPEFSSYNSSDVIAYIESSTSICSEKIKEIIEI